MIKDVNKGINKEENMVVIGTTNTHKVNEIRGMLGSACVLGDMEIYSLRDLGIGVDVPETGKTFAENAEIKAVAYRDILEKEGYTNAWILTDDSGLVISALDGKPGIMSARYAGEGKDYDANISKVLREMEDLEKREEDGKIDRSAEQVCAMCLAHTGTVEVTCHEGVLEGYIMKDRQGTNGFAYDSIFYSSDLMARVSKVVTGDKNTVSHRRKALDQIVGDINRQISKELRKTLA